MLRRTVVCKNELIFAMVFAKTYKILCDVVLFFYTLFIRFFKNLLWGIR
jgi:hypothetical protein